MFGGRFSRRQVLRRFAASAAAPAMLSGVAEAQDTRPFSSTGAEQAAIAQPTGTCVLLPQAVEGPYYFDPKLIRSDITEGRPGAPLKLMLRVIEAGPCTAMSNLRVDIWHADAGGVYSGYADQGRDRTVSTKGQTYLRGTQMTGADGLVTFQSVFPGWYPGRTPHIHVKVFLDTQTLVTGQVYFPDDLAAKIYATREPYNLRPTPDTTNATDFIFRTGEREGGGIVLNVSEANGGFVAALLIAVDKSGQAARKAEGLGGFFRRMIGR